MTKQVRIENADTSTHLVRLLVQEKTKENEWMTVKIVPLDFPSAMAAEYVYKGRRIIVEEYERD